MTIVDAHHHLWDPDVGDYPWMTGDYAVLRRRYDIGDLQPHLLRNDVSATIVVQVRADLAETVGLLESCTRTTSIAGVVGWVDLTNPAVGAQIDGLRNGAGGRHLVGVRHGAADEADPSWLLRDDVEVGMRELTARGLTFDLEITGRELDAANTLVRRHPDLRFIVDHGAKPPIAEGWSQDWADGISALAQTPNVWCKLSGLVTEASWTTWAPTDLQPYVDHLVAAFGPGRLMFGSDWPVCELAASYDRVLATAQRGVAALTSDERRDIFSSNALHVYQLPTSPTLGAQR
ncbi:amidohydrolase [Mycolicibacterium sp. P9-64]|uniref:amidohydrolase family protein n=1 Tax=Mycolicibacterium sp. P9-64 TaxID=2024612 RepID=UPI0011ECC667|nr:amidohydrolase family protein [Mycolicibacterium sp. P9-64]KAA0077224.1 amidohydrolase [Mycolicibacterium sp. P9-64]